MQMGRSINIIKRKWMNMHWFQLKTNQLAIQKKVPTLLHQSKNEFASLLFSLHFKICPLAGFNPSEKY